MSDGQPPKDSEFIFARVQFNMAYRALWTFAEAPWHHDYPYSEDFILSMLKNITKIHVTEESYKIVRLDDPEIFKFPFLYFSEPGFMELTNKEVTNLREWFNRGGFAVFDDFRQRDLDNLTEQMNLVFPGREFRKLTSADPIFKTFYEIDDINMPPPYEFNSIPMVPTFYGYYDDEGRLIAVANHDNDFGELFEWVDKGERPLDQAAKATRMMINYLIYGMTH